MDDVKDMKGELETAKEEIKEICEKLTINQGHLTRKYDHILSVVKGIESTLHKHEQEISYYSCKVVVSENEKAAAVKAEFNVLEEWLSRQDDIILDLRDEAVFLSLGADPYLPGRYIVSFLRVFKQFACNIPRG